MKYTLVMALLAVGTLSWVLQLICLSNILDTTCPLPDVYSPSYVEAAWYAWWEKKVSYTHTWTTGETGGGQGTK